MRLSRPGAALVLVAAVAAVITWPDVPLAARSLRGDDFPAALLGLAHLALAAVSGWLLLVTAAGLARIRVPGVPRRLRALLFVAVVTSLAAPAHADGRHDLTGLPLPDRPTVAATPVVPTAVPPTDVVTVRPGDTLWDLAAATLPSDAGPADVARACRAWHLANRTVIGPDPDLILPGQVLHPPREDAS